MRIELLREDPHYEIEEWELHLDQDERACLSKESRIPVSSIPHRKEFTTGSCFDAVVFPPPYDDPVEALLAPIAERLRAEKKAAWREADARAWAEQHGYHLVKRP